MIACIYDPHLLLITVATENGNWIWNATKAKFQIIHSSSTVRWRGEHHAGPDTAETLMYMYLYESMMVWSASQLDISLWRLQIPESEHTRTLACSSCRLADNLLCDICRNRKHWHKTAWTRQQCRIFPKDILYGPFFSTFPHFLYGFITPSIKFQSPEAGQSFQCLCSIAYFKW